MEKQGSSPKFEISAAVVFRLGEELISDVVQALVELVKNSYDADASWVRVSITTPRPNAAPGSSEAIGKITIEDDGHGMTESDLQRGWLMIANSQKKLMKDKGEKTEKLRTPVGDKGLGRLGVQRLGYDVEIVSRIANIDTKEIELKFSWRDFEKANRLSDVPVELNTKPRSKIRSGTRIVVTDIKDPDQWTGEIARLKLQRSLAELISPFREVRDFNVSVVLDGEDIPIAEIAEQLRDTAAVRYRFTFDGESFSVDGKVRLDFVARAQKAEDQKLLQQILKDDEGQAFYEYLIENENRGRPPLLEFHRNSKWLFSFKFEQKISDSGGLRLAEGGIANPGPFKGEVDYLLLDNEDSIAHLWDSLSEYRRYVEELSGIRVYRDGFGIRVGEDWLNLGRQQTSGGSMYGLRPKNVIGFVALSAQENRVLLETTSREGFQKTPHYLNFYALLQQFIKWSSQAQEYLRRGALGFLKDSRARDAGLVIGKEIESATEMLRDQALSIDRREKTLATVRESIKQFSTGAKARVQQVTKGDEQFSLYYQDKLNSINKLMNELDALVDRVGKTLDEYEPESTAIIKAQQILDAVLERDERLRQELAMFYEGVALGLTAEALSHEIAGITDNLAQRSSALSSHISQIKLSDEKVVRFVEHVKSTVAALRKQLAHLDPSLRYVRERKEKINVSLEIGEIQRFYKNRFSNNGIQMDVVADAPFSIQINRGKFSQIFDNILLNSEYWLRESLRRNPDFSGIVTVQISNSRIFVWDNGPGVALSIEDSLFDPFITTKEQGKGRGLGLFIVQQLLDSEGCSISLLHERNDEGRRYKFEIDFKGALCE